MQHLWNRGNGGKSHFQKDITARAHLSVRTDTPECECACASVSGWVCEYFIIFIRAKPNLSRFACAHACVHRSMPQQPRSKHSHVKAIIISPPAIITTSDSPLPAKLISPSFQVSPPPSLPQISPSRQQHPDQSISLVFVLFLFLLFLCVWQLKEKPVFHPFFSRLYLLRLLCFTEMCLYPESNSSCWTCYSSAEMNKVQKKKAEIERKIGRERQWLLGNHLVVLALQKPICTSFPLKSSRQRHGWRLHSGSGFYNLHVFRVSLE